MLNRSIVSGTRQECGGLGPEAAGHRPVADLITRVVGALGCLPGWHLEDGQQNWLALLKSCPGKMML